MPLLRGEEHASVILQPDLDMDVLMPHIATFPHIKSTVWSLMGMCQL